MMPAKDREVRRAKYGNIGTDMSQYQQPPTSMMFGLDYYYPSYSTNPINHYGQFQNHAQHSMMHHQVSPTYNYSPQLLDFHQASARSYQDAVNNYAASNNTKIHHQTSATHEDPYSDHKRNARLTRSRTDFFQESQTLDSRGKKSFNLFASLFGKAKSKQSDTIHLARHKSPARPTMQAGFQSQRSAPSSLKRRKSSPIFAAHQANCETVGTIDIYLIRQIARSCMVSRGIARGAERERERAK